MLFIACCHPFSDEIDPRAILHCPASIDLVISLAVRLQRPVVSASLDLSPLIEKAPCLVCDR